MATQSVRTNKQPVDTDSESFVLQFGTRGIVLRVDAGEEPTNLPSHAKVLARSVSTLVRAVRIAQQNEDLCAEDAALALVGIECLSGLAAEIAERIKA
jgi:hypothetical protein